MRGRKLRAAGGKRRSRSDISLADTLNMTVLIHNVS